MTHLVISNNEEALRASALELMNKTLARTSTNAFTVIPTEDPDIHLLDALAGEQSLGIAEIRSFTKILHKKPFREKTQVGIILGFEAATTEAQNALLKEFEDHPSSVCYILGVLDESNLLATIRSRAAVHYVSSTLAKKTDTELQKLAEAILSEKTDTATVYATINKRDWTRAEGEALFAHLYELSQKAPEKQLLMLLQKCSEYLRNNIAPKQVIVYFLLARRLKV